MRIICWQCGRDIDEIGQDNMSHTMDPLCEDCCYNDNKIDDTMEGLFDEL